MGTLTSLLEIGSSCISVLRKAGAILTITMIAKVRGDLCDSLHTTDTVQHRSLYRLKKYIIIYKYISHGPKDNNQPKTMTNWQIPYTADALSMSTLKLGVFMSIYGMYTRLLNRLTIDE